MERTEEASYSSSSSSLKRANSHSIHDSNKRRVSLPSNSTSPSFHSNKNKSISLPKSPRNGGYSEASALGHHHNNSLSSSHGGPVAPHQVRSPSSSSNSSGGKSSVEVRHGKKSGQIWLPEGVVDMASFGPILTMDEVDPTREFSKALVWAWCDQAEMALEEMEQHLAAGLLIPLGEKAHYLKGSSASLGLVKVASTCQSIYHIHFPPSLAHLRAFSYTGKGNSELSTRPQAPLYTSPQHLSSGSSSGSSSSSSSSSFSSRMNTGSLASPSTPYSSDSSMENSPSGSIGVASEKMQHSASYSPRFSPVSENGQYNAFPFEQKSGNGTLSPSLGIYASHTYTPNAYQSSSSSSSDIAPLVAFTSNMVLDGARDKKAEQAEEVAAHFEQMKMQRAKALLEKLRFDIKEGSQWLYTYYKESDKYAGIPSHDI